MMKFHRRRAPISACILLAVLLAFVVSACAAGTATPIATEPATSSTAVADSALVDTAAVDAIAPLTSTAATTATKTAPAVGGISAASDAAAAVASRTPIPTATPSNVDRKINQVTESLGLTGKTFLGLTTEDWVNLGISILIVLAGYFIGTRLLMSGLKWAVRRTSMQADNTLINELGPEITWLTVLLFARFAIIRLDFLSDSARTTLDDIIFTAGLVIVAIAAVKIIKFAAQRYQADLRSKNGEPDVEKLDPVILAVERVTELFVLILAASIGLSHFGIGVSAMAAMILVVGFGITFGAQNVISDAISGFVILVDQPFRIGDGLLLKEPDTTGTVVQIGARTTRILTWDNREVIVPNSRISESQIVNYSYPDPTYRLHTDLRIAYDSDLDKVREIITAALQAFDDVLTDKPVEVLFHAYGNSARHVRVRWWINNFADETLIISEANAIIENSLEKAGIQIPFQTYDLNLKQTDEHAGQEDGDTDQKSD